VREASEKKRRGRGDRVPDQAEGVYGLGELTGPVLERVGQASLDELKRWMAGVFKAPSIDDVFAGS
jgi:hypothetical protein